MISRKTIKNRIWKLKKKLNRAVKAENLFDTLHYANRVERQKGALNLMRIQTAIMSLPGSKRVEFWNHLETVLMTRLNRIPTHEEMVNSSAKDLAEALSKTIGVE